ncbi:hypothetical protein PHYSODRAFT_508162 [Phytophthora sojae]|uniref:HTH psq-type domain-containing protein n=1 Tax=Phytophthora sojae (strain P6497) TaxID=1094619 RepID=G4ZPI4_PHYSP|nr:hypothetical protein PHYSODRAFT_508162 [Phytophthora sojae]EGZ15808.1 hypothetical protein PHYSODRAFT_508162 [Phytophthora sojae]|eukprot:XP_009529557.1 hypothetical protein PHYSODRAFT_508162 [Phytophthora sojae]
MVTTPRKQRSYIIAEKRGALQLIDAVGEAAALRQLGYPRRNLRDWAAKKAKIFDYRGAQTSKTLKGRGRKEIIPFSHALVTFMKDMRRDEEPLCTQYMLKYIKLNYQDWLVQYLESKKSEESGYNAIMRLLQRFAKRYDDLNVFFVFDFFGG